MIGIKDEEFIRGNVPMTKQEIRILTIAKARIEPRDIVVDIGAGTGSLSVEAARIAKIVFAIERREEAAELIEQNAEKFDLKNIVVINAEAPNGLEAASNIKVVFIGGSGGRLLEILDTVDRRLKVCGRIVVNSVTIQTAATAINYFKNHTNYEYEAIQVQINRLKDLGQYDMAQALNPVYIITATKIEMSKAANVLRMPTGLGIEGPKVKTCM